MMSSFGFGKYITAKLVLILFLLLPALPTLGSQIQIFPLNTEIEKSEPNKIFLYLGKSIILKTPWPIQRLSEPNSDVASVILLSPTEIYIAPNGLGLTNLMIWRDKNAIVPYELEVGFDISRLKERLFELLPQEKELRVISSADSITLAGRVSSTNSLDQALSITESFAPSIKDGKEKTDGKKVLIKNLVEVAGIHQVMLEVRVAEITKRDLKQLGFNFHYFNGTEFMVGMLGGLGSLNEIATSGTGSFNVSSNVNALFRFGSEKASWTGLIDALKEDGVVKVLAEPTLITMSGQNASFLAGGEFPVPVPDEDGIAIEYKTYGVGLNFLPTVLSQDRINVRVTPEVSELDYANSLTYSGFTIPGLSVRRATTTVEMGDGQSFAIAGLLKANASETISKYPLLGDLPILGMLFRSSAYKNNETELVIVVTPRLVKPSHITKQPLPTDFYIAPGYTDLAFPEFDYTVKKTKLVSGGGTLDGDFGHAIPKP
jgi:pilus assembly protein CpaC